MKLSIITVNLNNAEGLQETIESVVSQTFTDFEYIVIDGGSTDGSVEIIKQYTDKITYWVSELDKGIYNAMNKGILQAKGKYCLFLNSGDWLTDENVISDFILSDFAEDFIVGNVFLVDEKNISTLLKSEDTNDLTFDLFYRNTLPHQAAFIKRDLFSKIGLYDEMYRIVSDWEFFIKAFVFFNCTYRHFDRIITNFDITGISYSKENDLKVKSERDDVFQSKYSFIYKSHKTMDERLIYLYSHEEMYREYMNLKNGKLGFIIKLILFLKNRIK